jgi:D-glycero-D-manno-heptose 1,7-bisphosphate phosphatase
MTMRAYADNSRQAEWRRVAFIDRDGVINEELQYVYRREDFLFLSGAVEGLRHLQSQGFALVVITNQAGIAKGLYSRSDFQELTAYMISALQEAGVALSAVYFCPHHPHGSSRDFSTECSCRKPKPGMILAAAREFSFNLRDSILIGDKLSDIDAGKSAGVPINILVESGHSFDVELARNQATSICRDLGHAARWVESNWNLQRKLRSQTTI